MDHLPEGTYRAAQSTVQLHGELHGGFSIGHTPGHHRPTFVAPRPGIPNNYRTMEPAPMTAVSRGRYQPIPTSLSLDEPKQVIQPVAAATDDYSRCHEKSAEQSQPPPYAPEEGYSVLTSGIGHSHGLSPGYSLLRENVPHSAHDVSLQMFPVALNDFLPEHSQKPDDGASYRPPYKKLLPHGSSSPTDNQNTEHGTSYGTAYAQLQGSLLPASDQNTGDSAFYEAPYAQFQGRSLRTLLPSDKSTEHGLSYESPHGQLYRRPDYNFEFPRENKFDDGLGYNVHMRMGYAILGGVATEAGTGNTHQRIHNSGLPSSSAAPNPVPTPEDVGRCRNRTSTQADADVEAAKRDANIWVACRWERCSDSVPLSNLRRHLHEVHGVDFKSNSVTCRWLGCVSSGMRGDCLVRHLKSGKHLKLKINCPYCKRLFTRGSGLKMHLTRP